MKTLGLIGGMSWESTATYYSLLNRGVRERVGGLHSAELLLWSFDFARIEALQAAGDWDTATREMVTAAGALVRGGADCIAICTNTMHKMANDVAAAVDVPLLHIAEGTGRALTAAGLGRPLLLGTRFTMEQDFYTGYLRDGFALDVRIPASTDRDVVHRVIYEELCRGDIRDVSRAQYLEIVARGVAAGADSVIFGCTEVGLLISADELTVPAFDTTALHVEALLDFALG